MYRYLIILLPLLTACASSAAQQQAASSAQAALAGSEPVAPEFASRYAHLPADAADALARLDACRYFSGEFNGDGSARDKDVNARMEALGCAVVETQIAALREKYAAQPAVRAALDAAGENTP